MKNERTTSFKIYTRLLGYLKGLASPFLLSLFGFLLFAGSQPMLAKMMEFVIAAIEHKDSEARWTLPLMAIGIFLARGIGSFLGVYFNEFVGASVIRSIKNDVFSHMAVLPAKFYDDIPQGQLLHRLNSGVNQIQAAVTNALKTVIREGFTIIFLLIYVFWRNWQLSLTFLAVAPILALMVNYTTRRFRKIGRKNEVALGKAMHVSKELIGNYGVVRAFGAVDYEKARYAKVLDEAFSLQMKIRRLTALFTPLSQFIVAFAIAGIVFLLLTPYFLNAYTASELIGYLTAVSLLPKSMKQLGGVGTIIQRGVVGAELVFDILDAEPEKDHGEYEAKSVRGDIEIRDLSFRYPNTEKSVLKHIDLNINSGEMVALVGHSGSGKSTLASLMGRSYDITEGAIYLDGVNIEEYRISNLRRHIAMVNQNISLFDDTIRNNIAYGDIEYPDDAIWMALDRAHAREFVEQLPEGLDTIVGENGLKLSGGQRQRLSIARAFLKDSPILILDEATSALDNEAESVITEAIEELSKSRTTIIIAHRLSTILQADRLIVLQDGNIVEQGKHEELLQQNGTYAKLYSTEFH